MNYLLRLLITSIFFSTSLNAEENKTTTYISTSTFLYTEPVSIHSVKNNWKGKYWSNGEKQIGTFLIEAGIKKGKWSVGGILREDNYINFSSDTADLYYAVENSESIDRTAPYSLSIDAYRFRGKGIKVQRRFQLNESLKASLGFSIFKASNLLDGKLTGTAQSSSSDSYNYNVDVDYLYEEDTLFDRNLKNSLSGKGVTLDAAIKWKATPHLNLSLKATDIAGLIRWEDVPFTTANANSNNVSVNDSGFTSVNPILTGSESFQSHFTQRLKPTFDVAINYDLKRSPYSLDFNIKHFENLKLYGFGIQKQSNLGKFGFRFWPTINTSEVSYKHKKISLALGIDDLKFTNARTAWLSLSYGIN